MLNKLYNKTNKNDLKNLVRLFRTSIYTVNEKIYLLKNKLDVFKLN